MRSGGFKIADRASRRNRYLLMPLASKGCQHSILCYSALKIRSGPFAPERPSRSRAGSRRRMDNRVLGGRHVRVRASPRQLPPFRTNRRPLRTLLHGHGPAVLGKPERHHEPGVDGPFDLGVLVACHDATTYGRPLAVEGGRRRLIRRSGREHPSHGFLLHPRLMVRSTQIGLDRSLRQVGRQPLQVQRSRAANRGHFTRRALIRPFRAGAPGLGSNC
jgi:hypothetical protein